jgi:hypothetical protein
VGDYVKSTDEISHKAYYQWVPFVLFLQGCLFYLPHLIFKSWEGGKMKGIIAGLNPLIIDRNDRWVGWGGGGGFTKLRCRLHMSDSLYDSISDLHKPGVEFISPSDTNYNSL